DAERPHALRIDVELGGPAVRRTDVGQLAHPVERQLLAVRAGDDDVGRDQVMAIAEDGGGDGDGLAYRRLGRPARAVDDRPDIGDGDPSDHRLRTYPSRH